MKILLINNNSKIKTSIRNILESQFSAQVTESLSLQAAIELLDGSTENIFDLVICNYGGTSSSLLGILLACCKKTPCLFVLRDLSLLTEISKPEGILWSEPIDSKLVELELVERIQTLLKMGLTEPQPIVRDEMAEEAAKTQVILKNQTAKVEKILTSEPLDVNEAREAAESSLEVVKDVVSKYGFTPEVQTLVTRVAALTLQVIGTKPELSEISNHLKLHEGKYITSHSIMLAEISCAIAHKVGWSSSSTYFKLALAAYLHDLPLQKNYIARCHSMAEIRAIDNLSEEDLSHFVKHPTLASEYAQRMQEIPPDVDMIVSQHHERPDGQGFPRGLFARNIGALSCLFIIAEDMVRFFISRDSEHSIEDFIAERGEQYRVGNFKSIMKAIERKS